MVSYLNLTKELSSGTNHHVAANAWGTTPSSAISQGHTMIDGTAFSHDGLRMDDDATEVVNAESFPYVCLDGYRDPCGDFDATFEDKPHRLRWDVTLIEPPKDAVHQDGLKTLGQQHSH